MDNGIGEKATLELDSAKVFEEYRQRIYRFVLRFVRDHALADDLTQETFLRAHNKLESLKETSTLSTWLYRIATNVCYDHFKRASTRYETQHEDEDAQVEDRGPGLDQVIDQADMGECIREFIELLPDSYRTVLMLHDLKGMTNPEIAKALQCPLSTVKIRLHRARHRLKAALGSGCNFSRDQRGVFVCERKPEQKRD